MTLVVVESPFTGDVNKNVKYARLCMLDSLLMGESPFLSHLLYTQVLDDKDPDQRKLGIYAGWHVHENADVIAFYCDRGTSDGMLKAFIKIHNDDAEMFRKVQVRFLGEGNKYLGKKNAFVEVADRAELLRLANVGLEDTPHQMFDVSEDVFKVAMGNREVTP